MWSINTHVFTCGLTNDNNDDILIRLQIQVSQHSQVTNSDLTLKSESGKTIQRKRGDVSGHFSHHFVGSGENPHVFIFFFFIQCIQRVSTNRTSEWCIHYSPKKKSVQTWKRNAMRVKRFVQRLLLCVNTFMYYFLKKSKSEIWMAANIITSCRARNDSPTRYIYTPAAG